MILTNSGVLKLMQRIKSFITSQLNTKAPSVHTHTLSEIDDLSSLSMGGGYSKSEVDTLLTGKADTSHTHTTNDITDFPSYGTTANTICEGNDSRLSDARTPTSHTHTKSEITDFPTIPTVNNATLTIQKNGTTVKTFTANASSNVTANITVPTKTSDLTNDSGFLTSHQDLSGYVSRSGGSVMTGKHFARNVSNDSLILEGGSSQSDGAFIELYGGSHPNYAWHVDISLSGKVMRLYPDGGWNWNGSAVQVTSDQRLKQQITEIDDKLLDAWEDVTLCQFKYNDAVEQKGRDNARLHTGYVVQQIDTACKYHDVDISEYGLYCHEEYPEETEEVEVEQEDGTIKKETKVIREASEHYSLRYTEVYAIECAYLRRENNKLKQQMQQYTESLSKLEERLKALEQTSK